MDFKLLKSEQIYIGWIFNVRRDTLLTPAAKQVDMEIVEHANAVTIIPFDKQGRVWFVRQYRHAVICLILKSLSSKYF